LLDDRAHYWLDRRDYANAVADLRAALDIDPESARTSNFLAWLYVTAPPELIIMRSATIAGHMDPVALIDLLGSACFGNPQK
jgi:hypothetical protein